MAWYSVKKHRGNFAFYNCLKDCLFCLTTEIIRHKIEDIQKWLVGEHVTRCRGLFQGSLSAFT